MNSRKWDRRDWQGPDHTLWAMVEKNLACGPHVMGRHWRVLNRGMVLSMFYKDSLASLWKMSCRRQGWKHGG